MSWSIYRLVNPADGKVFYVGMTRRSLSERLSGHINSSRNPCNKVARKIASITSSGLEPLIELIESAATKNAAMTRESAHIAMGIENGDLLENYQSEQKNTTLPRVVAHRKRLKANGMKYVGIWIHESLVDKVRSLVKDLENSRRNQ